MFDQDCAYITARGLSYLIQKKVHYFLIFTAIEEERGKQQLFSGIENFDASKLKHTETCEKNPLPTKEIIEEEKKA